MQPVPRPSLDLLFWGKRMPCILLRLELEASALKCNEQKAGRPRFIFVYVNFNTVVFVMPSLSFEPSKTRSRLSAHMSPHVTKLWRVTFCQNFFLIAQLVFCGVAYTVCPCFRPIRVLEIC